MVKRMTAVGILVAGALTGCGDQQDVVKTRLEAIEARLGRIETRISNAEKDIPDAQALRDELKTLDGRIAAADARATEALTTARTVPAAPAAPTGARPGAPAAAAPAPGAPGQIDTARRDALGTLNAEYRQRLEALRGGQDDATTAQRRDQRRELSRWFREQRRAILLGQTATPPPAP